MTEIGGTKFNVPQPKGMRSFVLQQRILPIVGRVAEVLIQLLATAGRAVATPGDIDKLLEKDSDELIKLLPGFMPSLGRIFSDMPEGELERLTRELLRDATVVTEAGELALFNNQGGAYDTVMQGRNIDGWLLLWHAVKVWYPDFFARAAGLRVRLTKKDTSSAAAPKTSEASSAATG